MQEMLGANQAHDSYEELNAMLNRDRATVDEGCEDAIENIVKRLGTTAASCRSCCS